MAIAIILVLVVVASVLFHLLAPWHMTPAASNWGSIDTTLLITLVITGIFFIAITLFMAIAVIRFRHREGARAHYQPESRKLEGWLVILTSLGIIGMLAPGLVVYNDFVQVPQEATQLEVIAQQWQWAFRFPGQDGKLGKADVKWIDPGNPFGLDRNDPAGQDDVLIMNNEVRLPIDRPVKVLLRAKDVLHDFYIPQMRAKMDMVPGMVSHFWFTPTRLGKFEVLCAEYCGLGHYNMRGHLVVEEQGAFDQWFASQPTFAQTLTNVATPSRDSLLEKGRQLVESHGCHACHSQDGSSSLGPGWKDLYGRSEQLADGTRVQVDEAYLKESILEPQARLVQGYPPVMVAYTFSQDELAAVVAFIKSLSAVGQKEQGPADAQNELAAQGQRLAESLGCLACHSVDGSQGIGPGWQGLYGKTQTLADGSQIKVDEGYLKDSVRHPGAAIVKGYAAVMPTFTPNDKELDALIAFIKSKAAVDADAGKVESGKSP
ncbi:cytochrome c oxidase subunit II [Pseudomonas chlororaphis]|uniref:cytochrome c oxidase subunit II n=1 Tax=Pseudomonas chlororaphis TaxID=587753 RepID=UPI002365C0D2|nr:cytochrome c oxidase subunit II [Pseudomonas chlororaphis]WDG55855.1 cytochrome c oxidase subunit II [Pseudomonas chlororaphis]WDH35759.1 cytochrome c oxidase subunit II [Pseudomonas chlororaphis]WDH41844.1 cytochrome c oxidase subunit II [Pseudomonas chlororaphis]WDH53727.1 cytochrome c oxidase subunit II [Pseudomonas chlororaphis]WDH88944.1 cytochrome c oxidase subunit II [Pseudomonas chlororaphis]